MEANQQSGLNRHVVPTLGNTFRPLVFRPDIQGLRAIAILLVVFCHAGMPGFAGGYIGVDIFFVLSGYLITGLLVTEVQSSNKIRFLHFYARRLKRLLPALLFVMLCSAGLAFMILSPSEQLTQAQAAKSVPLWLSNFHFGFSDLDYFAPESGNNIFLHTWSLAVEEQFYLFWPLVLFLLLLKVDPLPSRPYDKTFNLRYGLLMLMLLSLGLCIYTSYKAPMLSFYLMPTRAWQFALGGMTFLLTNSRGSRITPFITPGSTLLSGVLGSAMIVLSMTLLDSNVLYPGLNAILPTVGAALILLSTGFPESRHKLTQYLSLGWVQKIGDYSYSWYLWHWPVLLLGKILFPVSSIGLTAVLILLSLGLAGLTYYLIENPARKATVLNHRPIITVTIASVAMAVGLMGMNKWQSVSELHARSPEQLRYQRVKTSLPVIYQHGCDDWYRSARVVACSYGDPDSTNTLTLIGDSIGAQWFSTLAEIFVSKGWHMVVFTKSACPVVDEPFFYERIGQQYTVCERWRDQVLGYVATLNPDLVFIGNSSSYNFTKNEWKVGTEKVLNRLSPTSDQVFIIRPTPRLEMNGPDCLARHAWQPEFLSRPDNCSSRISVLADQDMIEGISALINQRNNLYLLDLNDLICPNGLCQALLDEQIVYRDASHIADSFIEQLSTDVEKRITPLLEGRLN